MDYFSAAGTKAFTDFYDNKAFDDELRAMMRENSGDLFSDSYGDEDVYRMVRSFERKAFPPKKESARRSRFRDIRRFLFVVFFQGQTAWA